MAVAFLRRAKGSSDPVGTRPTWKNAATESSRSANDSTCPAMVRGQFTFDRSRQILLPDGLTDRLRFTVMFRVLAPHDALQFRKLTDHTGEKVGLAQIRGPLASLFQFVVLRSHSSRR